jgi:hypothetical protein
MDEPNNTTSDTPGYQSKRDAVASKRTRPRGGATTPVRREIEPPLLEVDADPAASMDGTEDQPARVVGTAVPVVEPELVTIPVESETPAAETVFSSERVDPNRIEETPIEITPIDDEAIGMAPLDAAADDTLREEPAGEAPADTAPVFDAPIDDEPNPMVGGMVPAEPADALPGDAAEPAIEMPATIESDRRAPEPAFAPDPAPTFDPAPVTTPTPAPEPIALAAPSVSQESRPTANAVILRAPEGIAATAVTQRGTSFTLWALLWVVAWAGAMALTLNHRFDRKFDWNTSYFSIAARNLLREGFVELHGGIYLNTGEFAIGKDSFYAGHPPLTAWILAGWMRLFSFVGIGDGDAAIRALPLTFTAVNLLLLYALVRRALGGGAALATMVVCSLLPMTAYYAQVVNMEPFTLTFLLMASIGYMGYAKSKSAVGFLLLCLAVIAGCWTDWPMYVFAGFLAVMHLFKRPPVTGTDETGAEVRAGRPILGSMTLIVLPVAVFACFMVYLSMNHATFADLRERATERMSAGDGHSWRDGLNMLATKNPSGERPWALLVGLFTPPALALAVLGLFTWRTWSRRLALASGDDARRAMFRLLTCFVLMQLTYTLAFPQGAAVHEFWQYYLIVPAALFAGGFCTWLTVAGGFNRGFGHGLMDRLGWAVAALIPLCVIGPIATPFPYRMQMAVFGHDVMKGDDRLADDYAGAIKKGTAPGDVILTDLNGDDSTGDKRGYALPWYADRAIVANGDPNPGPDAAARDTHSLGGIDKLRETFKGRRVLYLWTGAGPKELGEAITKKYAPLTLGRATLFVIDDAKGGGAAAPSTTTKPASK